MPPTNEQQYNIILKNAQLSNSDKIEVRVYCLHDPNSIIYLQLISEIIENEDRPEQLLELHKNRAVLYYKEQKYNGEL